MAAGDDGGGLVGGPRGRRLCWSVLDRLCPESGSSPFWRAGFHPNPEQLLEVLEGSLPAVHLDALSDPGHEELLLECLADAVDSARYWQEPDELDLALGDVRLLAALAPVAVRIATAPGASWWSTGLDLTRQVFVDEGEEGVGLPPVFHGARHVLKVWHEQVVGPSTRHRGRWVGGPWWSTPSWSILATDLERYGASPPLVAATTRSRPGLGAVGLLLNEDSFDTRSALCWPVRPTRPVRVVEIDDVVRWMELVRRYGIDVTGRRKVSWSRASGLNCRWLLPDWSAVAEDYDAVHLTVNGYLRCSGRALAVDASSSTFLAGWDPDITFWLADVLETAGAQQRWRAVGSGHARQWQLEHIDC